MVVATQNPRILRDLPLPDSQLDRFLIRMSMGYPDRLSERTVLRSEAFGPQSTRTLSQEDLAELKSASEVSVPSGVEDYLLDLVAKTREDSGSFEAFLPVEPSPCFEP